MVMVAFHGKPELKAFYLERVAVHAAADEIVQGQYWENGKGCAVGCCIHGSEHARYETELGIPRTIARLEDCIFEGLKNGEAKAFPLAFLSAVPVGADLSLVTARFMLWLLADESHGVIRFANTERTKVVIQTVITLYERKLRDDEPSVNDWMTAAYAADADAAYAAAADADADAAYAAAADAAYAAAADAAYAAAADAAYAAYAAYAAADADAAYAAADADAAKKSYYEVMRDQLLELLASAPIPEVA